MSPALAGLPDHGRISPSLPRTRRGTDEYASGCSSGRRLPARTSTTLCTCRPPDGWIQETQACHEPSRSCISQASRWPTIPPLISTIGGHQGASRLLTWVSIRTCVLFVKTGLRRFLGPSLIACRCQCRA